MAGFIPTPRLDPQNFIDNLALVDGAVWDGMDTIRNILELEMPPMTAELNVAKGWVDQMAIKKPKMYGIAPGVLTDRFIDSVLVGSSTNAKDGAPGTIQNFSQVVVYSVGKRIEAESQVQDCHRRGSVIKGILHEYLTGYINADGCYVWKELKYTGMSFLPEPYTEFAGLAIYYQMFQPPGENAWANL